MTRVLYLYLFAAVAGCLLVLVSLFSGGDHDGSGSLDSGSADHVGITDGSAQTHGALSADGHGHGHGHTADAASSLGTALGWMLSVQLWTYLLAFGGITGLLLRLVAHVQEPLAGGCALAVGLSTALAARSVLRRVVSSSDSGTTSHDRLVGSSAQVLIPASAGGTGKIRLAARGQMIDLLARASDGGALAQGAAVSILDVREGVAEVTRDEDDKPDAQGSSRPATSAAGPALAHIKKETTAIKG